MARCARSTPSVDPRRLPPQAAQSAPLHISSLQRYGQYLGAGNETQQTTRLHRRRYEKLRKWRVYNAATRNHESRHETKTQHAWVSHLTIWKTWYRPHLKQNWTHRRLQESLPQTTQGGNYESQLLVLHIPKLPRLTVKNPRKHCLSLQASSMDQVQRQRLQLLSQIWNPTSP